MAKGEGSCTPDKNHVRFTSALTRERRRQVNQYVRHERIGKGQHGEVFLCTNEHGQRVALKVVKRNHPRDRIKLLRRNNPLHSSDRPTVSSTEHNIRREIAIMKRCHHANIVSLLEVIDDSQQEKIYIAMEYLGGGEVQWADPQHKPTLSVSQIRRIFRDVILGLEYLHHSGIIHRDIKPANLLWTEDRAVVKIIDFGVAYLKTPMITSFKHAENSDDSLLFNENDLQRRVGTPSFLAPEVVWFDHVLQHHSPSGSSDTLAPKMNSGTNNNGSSRPRPQVTEAVDVWSLAVTLYCLLFGHTPFNVPETENENIYHNEYMLYHQICTCDWDVDETMSSDQAPTGGRHPEDSQSQGYTVINLLDRMLQKNPAKRATLSELKRTPWILSDIAEPKNWLKFTSPASEEPASTTFRWIKHASMKLLNRLPTSQRVSGL